MDWRDGDIENDDGETIYRISLYGKTKELKSVYLEINDFFPYFFVKIKPKWEKYVHHIVEQIKEYISKDFKESLVGYKAVDLYDLYGFNGGKLSKFIKLTFKNHTGMKRYEYKFKQQIYYPYLRQKTSFPIYESNISPFLRMMHIKDLKSVGWIEVNFNDLEGFGSFSPTYNDLNYITSWLKLKKIDDNNIVKFSIASFDIECTSGDGSFPQPDRETDQVIQIGISVSRYSENECYYKHILCLGKTDNIPGITVQWFNNEVDLLLAFPKLLHEINPDIITGYNINGFDFEYLQKRAIYLGIEIKFSLLSRVINELCPFIDRTLHSAAIGESKFKFYDMSGRVVIDLMKVIQRDYKLGSYKLDNVASNFIKDTILDISTSTTKIKINNTTNIKKGQFIKLSDDKCYKILKITDNYILVDSFINKNIKSFYIEDTKYNIKNNNITYIEETDKCILKTKNTYGLALDQYVVLIYNDGIIDNKYKDGKKFKILELDKDSITIEGKIDKNELLNHGYKVYWTQTKDDISPHDIFRLQKGSSSDRALVAKYCIQDCVLCNQLVNKLQIINNNVSMANVCSVPFAYIFNKGQGPKIHSLVAKKCREKKHLIPVLKQKKNNNFNKTQEEIEKEKMKIKK